MNEKIITYKKLINDEISKIHFSDKPKNLYEPLKYILSLKSKRLRPTLSILSYKLFQNEIDNIIKSRFEKFINSQGIVNREDFEALLDRHEKLNSEFNLFKAKFETKTKSKTKTKNK